MYKTHRQNHDFQIAYFLAGACHTPDGAYALLCDLKEDRENAIKNYEVSLIRTQAKKLKIEKELSSEDPIRELEAQADLLELKNGEEQGKVLVSAARDELAFICHCIELIRPWRKYADLSDSKAHEAAQQEEWKFELMHRAENFLLTTGTIPTDHFATMRQHPDFKTDILPWIDRVKYLMANNQGNSLLAESPVLKLLGVAKQLPADV
jgi:hypothetical protein